MRIKRLSAASFKIYTPGHKVVMIDPWLVGDPVWPIAEKAPAKLREIDVIIVTHAHFDHASGIEELVRLNKNIAVVAQFEFALDLMNRGVTNVVPIGFGGTAEVEGIKFSLVPASHTSSELPVDGQVRMLGAAAGYVIELEDGVRIYVSGDTGLTADMKYVIGDYFKPDISILPVTGFLVMEPGQAVWAANLIGSRYVIPCHDFPKEISDAGDPEGYREFLSRFPVQDSYKKVDEFLNILKKEYPHIKGVRIDIGRQVDLQVPDVARRNSPRTEGFMGNTRKRSKGAKGSARRRDLNSKEEAI